jgi:3'(2'), 5'-bisphosphate nucleotidase
MRVLLPILFSSKERIMDMFVAGLDLAPLLAMAREAGEAIMSYYGRDAGVRLKADRSPVTLADLAANEILAGGLARAYPGTVVISEESDKPPYAARRDAPHVFIVDPLDGTREFLAATGEFSVNIALVSGHRPVFGLLYAPFTHRLYCGGPGFGSFRLDGSGAPVPIATAKPAAGQELVVLLSRSHPDPGIEDIVARFAPYRSRLMGGALKFAAVAEGEGHIYPRARALGEWDVAAGHALVEGAGGSLTGLAGEPILYNTPELRAGPFLARA